MDVDVGALYHTLYVLTFSTSFGYLSIPCNEFIACYNYMLQDIFPSFYSITTLRRRIQKEIYFCRYSCLSDFSDGGLVGRSICFSFRKFGRICSDSAFGFVVLAVPFFIARIGGT